jgi:glucose-6-phosphate 1-dehydrogenase
LLPDGFAVVGNSRRPMTDAEFRARIAADFHELGAALDPAVWEWLAARTCYQPGDLDDPTTFQSLARRLDECDRRHGTGGNALFYLSTAPHLFGPTARRLGQVGLTAEGGGRWRRVIVEKPFGTDLESAVRLNRDLRAVLGEHQLFRIDHYLGKETVQNLMVLRFANGLFEPLWNRKYVDHVQVSVAETVGVEARGGYYDTAGALRDMVPNHLFQVLSLIAMEPPAALDADAVRDEQVKLLRAVRPIDPRQDAVRGQYAAGEVGGKAAAGYRSEPNVGAGTNTETFAALRLFVDNWRWAGVPFYLRTGKRLAARRSEVVVQFKPAPHQLFDSAGIPRCMANQLVLGLQPEETVSVRLSAKVPGPVVRVGSVDLAFDYAGQFGARPQTGYERLLYECLRGDQTLFQRADMAELGWRIVAPVQQAWAEGGAPDPYPAGSWGPAASAGLLAADGRVWREDDHCPVLGPDPAEG